MQKQRQFLKLTALFLTVFLCMPFGTFFADTQELNTIPGEEPQAAQDQQKEDLIDELQTDSKFFSYIEKDVFTATNVIERLPMLEETNSYAFKTAEGRYAIYYLSEEVKYESNGELIEKDVSLSKIDNAYVTKQNNVGLSLPLQLSDGVTLSAGEGVLSFIPFKDVSTVEAAFDENSNSITYTAAFGEGADLRYTPTLSGVKEDVILSFNTHQTEFSFALSVSNLSMYRDDDTFYFASGPDSRSRLVPGKIVVYDSKGRFAIGASEIAAINEESCLFTVCVPEEFLADPETVYPVYVDPTMDLIIKDENTGSNKRIEDASVYSGQPSTNFGVAYTCTVGNSASYGTGRTAVRFPGLYTSAVYTQIAPEQLETVEFFFKEASGLSGSTIKMYPMQSAWTEATVTWNNLGTYSGTEIASAALTAYGYSSFDITNYCAYYKGTTTEEYGFLLKNTNETINQEFYSSDFGGSTTIKNRPYVYLEYTPYISIDGVSTKSTAINESIDLHATMFPTSFDCVWSVTGASGTSVTLSNTTGQSTTLTCSAVAELTVTATAYNNNVAVATATCVIHVIPIPQGDYYIECAARNNDQQSFIKPTGHSSTIGAQIITNTLFNGTGIEGANENCIWKVTYQAANGGYYKLQFEENDLYLGTENGAYTVNTNLKQYNYYNNCGRFKIVQCASDNYRIVPWSDTAGTTAVALSSATAVNTNLVLKTYQSNNVFDDEWIFHRVLPRSGSELPHDLNYQTEFFSGSPVAPFLVDCYGYAVNYYRWTLYINRAGFKRPFPLRIGEGIPELYQNPEDIEEDLLDGVSEDAVYYGFEAIYIAPYNRYQQCANMYYKAAFSCNLQSGDFHWYRQGHNGLWSGKNGVYDPVSLYDASGYIIFDPQECDRGIYTTFLCYYAILPLSTLID